MTIPTSETDWQPCYRIIPSRFPPIGLFEDVADPADLDAVFEIEAMTNDRLREEVGNLQLVLRDDGIWAAGPQMSESGMKLDYQSGEVLDTFPARRACTRATGCADSIFFRANGGTAASSPPLHRGFSGAAPGDLARAGATPDHADR